MSENIGTFTVKKLCGICEYHPKSNDNDTCQKGHGIVKYDFDFLKHWEKECKYFKLKTSLKPETI